MEQERTVWTASHGVVNSASLKLWNKLGSQGESIICQLNDDEQFLTKTAEFLLRRGIESSADVRLARAIMRNNFWGAEEWISFYGIQFTEEQLEQIGQFPWPEDILNSSCPFHKDKTIRETHFAFLGLETFKNEPFTILKWQKIQPNSGKMKFYSYPPNSWYSDEKFASKPTCKFRWYLMPLEIVPDSESKIYQEQTQMLSEDYEVPLAVEEITKHFIYYKKNNIYLNQTRYGRCQDVSSYGGRVSVGDSDSDGLDVGGWSDGHRYYGIGLAASRKLPSLKS